MRAFESIAAMMGSPQTTETSGNVVRSELSTRTFRSLVARRHEGGKARASATITREASTWFVNDAGR
jgi:hypothetical protein